MQNGGETSDFGDSGEDFDFGDSDEDFDFGDSGEDFDFGDSGETSDFGDSGEDFDFGDSDETSDFGDSGEDFDFGDSGGDFDGDEGDSGENDNLGLCGDGFIQREDCSGYEDKGCKVVPGANENCDDGEFNGNYDHCKTDCSGKGKHCGDATLQREDCSGYEDKGCEVTPGANEICDDGFLNGRYSLKKPGSCNLNCRGYGEGGYCGDKQTNNDEECDRGDENSDTCEYGKRDAVCLVCTTSCKLTNGEITYCGDGKIDKANGEACDDGENKNGKYGYCKSDCSGLGKHCGDGIVNGDELCDDGEDNGKYGYCATNCRGYGLPECGKESGTPCGDNATGFVWSAESISSMNWSEAKIYCEKLDGNNYWRLPTISELRTLIRECEKTVVDGSCKVSSKDPVCLEESCWQTPCKGCSENNDGKYSLLGDSNLLSSSSSTSTEEGKTIVYGVDFKFGRIHRAEKSSDTQYMVRCVRKW